LWQTDVDTRSCLVAPDKPNLHYIDVHDATSDAIRDAFGTVSKKITALQQKLIVRTLTTTTISSRGRHQQSAVPALPRIQVIQR
jgi:hypothetical protein